MKFAKFLRTPIFKNICERLLLNLPELVFAFKVLLGNRMNIGEGNGFMVFTKFVDTIYECFMPKIGLGNWTPKPILHW